MTSPEVPATGLDLDAVRRRFADYRDHQLHAMARQWSCCSAHEVADRVPALLGEIDRLNAKVGRPTPRLDAVKAERDQARRERDTALARADSHRDAAHNVASQFERLRQEKDRLARIVKLVTELTHDTDGDDLDPDTNIPVGEVMRALAGESA